jgi:CheY-like chemotaxis protein
MTALDETTEFRSSRSVIVVEEDPFLRTLMAEHLEHAGYRVFTAGTLAEAHLQINAVKPDAVVLDVDLGPGSAGLKLARTLKSQSEEVGLVCLIQSVDPRFVGDHITIAVSPTLYVHKHLLGDPVALLVAVNSVVLKHRMRHSRAHDRRAPAGPSANTEKMDLKVSKELTSTSTGVAGVSGSETNEVARRARKKGARAFLRNIGRRRRPSNWS